MHPDRGGCLQRTQRVPPPITTRRKRVIDLSNDRSPMFHSCRVFGRFVVGVSGISRLEIPDSILHRRLWDAGFALDLTHRLPRGLQRHDLSITRRFGNGPRCLRQLIRHLRQLIRHRGRALQQQRLLVARGLITARADQLPRIGRGVRPTNGSGCWSLRNFNFRRMIPLPRSSWRGISPHSGDWRSQLPVALFVPAVLNRVMSLREIDLFSSCLSLLSPNVPLKCPLCPPAAERATVAVPGPDQLPRQ